MLRPRLILILIASTMFTAAICAFVFWMLAKGEDSASKASTQFATALVKNDPSLAPKGGADYLEGLRSQFGEVSDARVIDTRNHHVGSGDDGRTYYVADLLLQTARGAAVVQLEFDSMQLISDTVTNVRELEPREIKGLDDADLTTVAKAFVARGDEAEAGFDSLDVLAERAGEGGPTPRRRPRPSRSRPPSRPRSARPSSSCAASSAPRATSRSWHAALRDVHEVPTHLASPRQPEPRRRRRPRARGLLDLRRPRGRRDREARRREHDDLRRRPHATRARSPAAITRRARGCGRWPAASRTRFPTAGGSAARTPTGGTRSPTTGCRRTSSCSRSTTIATRA